MIGKTLTHYEIVAKLGAGGMGEVYRAQDKRLGRAVAVKVLPEAFAHDADRIARFDREAKLLASLNHANIGSLYGFEQDSHQHFLIMELIEGETLAERIHRGPLAIEDVLKIAHQIAEALEYAHDKGVIHRDLKPSNVKITPEGKVKVLDFGLAKAMASDSGPSNLSHSPTMMSAAGTHQGMILGTAAYMSPEQAKGLPVDTRSDVFSFGCVLFEMLAGCQAFIGDTVADVLAGVLAREPDLSRLPANLNPRISELLRRAIEKNARKRWHAVADIRVELEAILGDPRGTTIQPIVIKRPLWRRAAPVVMAIALTAVLTVWAMRRLTPTASPLVTRFAFVMPDDQLFTNPARQILSISPDGSQIVYVANNRLFLKPMRELSAIFIQGTDVPEGVANPVFSPDSASVAFWSNADGALKRIAVTGGAAVNIATVGFPFGISWGSDNNILIGQGSRGIVRAPANGGKPETIIQVKDSEQAHGPQLLPDGDSVLFTLATTTGADRWNKAQVMVQSLKSGARKVLFEGGSDARYLSTGHLIYGLSGTLLVVPFDVKTLALTGGPVPIVEGVRASATSATGSLQFSVSHNGSLVYVPGSGLDSSRLTLAMMDRGGGMKSLGLPPGYYGSPRISPNGKQLAFHTDSGKDATVWIYDLDGKSSVRRLTFGGENWNPLWSTDGQRILFTSDREGDEGIFSQPADGTGTATRVTKPDAGWLTHWADSWTPDGLTLLLSAIKVGDSSLWLYSVREKKASLFVDARGIQQKSSVSPDGHWVAYQSDENKGNNSVEIFVEPIPATGAKFQITKTGYNNPLWSRDGKELFFNINAGAEIFYAEVRTQPAFSFGDPVPLPIRNFIQSPGMNRQFDVTPDGKRFVVTLPPGATATDSAMRLNFQIQVVLNWFEEVKQRSSH